MVTSTRIRWNDDSGEQTVNGRPLKRQDGKYEERFSDTWLAVYSEEPANGLWQVEVFRHDLPEWMDTDYDSLEEAQQAARDYYDQV